MKAFYHSADLDGHCSGAIVKHLNPECELFPINYGQEFPWDRITPYETVFMVDFTLQPFDQMERLSQMCRLVWIDHHKTEVEEALKRKFNPQGLREIGIGACLLTWQNLTRKPVPEAVQLLAEYDVWNHDNPKTLPFQYGFRFFEDTRPDNQELWGEFFSGDDFSRKVLIEVVQTGETLLTYEDRQNAKFCRAYAFETALRVPSLTDAAFAEFPAVCCNRGFTNSKVFDSVYDPTKHDLMITFCRLKPPAYKWTVSLYSTKEDVDCGQIARLFGGGGHKGAAGFQCEQLPFEH